MFSNTPISANHFLIKQLPQATAFIDKNFKVVFVSDKWVEEFNLSTRDIINEHIQDLVGISSKQWENNILRCFKGKRTENFQENYTSIDRETRWLKWNILPWYNENESVIGAIVQAEDITAQISKEQKLEQVQFILKETNEIGKIGHWKYNQSQDIFSSCPMINNLLEIEEDSKLTLDEYIEFYKIGYNRNTLSMAIFSAMENKQSWNEKLEVLTAKGNQRWVNVSGKPLYCNGKYIGIIGIVQDITDYVIKEHQTKSNEHLLKTLINNIPLHIYIKDTQSKKLLANRSELDHCGISNEADIIGKDDFDIYDKELAQKYRDEDLEVMISQTPMINKELSQENSDGTTNYFLSSKIPLKGPNGETTGLVGITMDISDIKQKEKDLRNLIKVSSEQNKKLLNFAHIISHNLRSHSANFSMLLEFLIEEKEEAERQKIFGMLTDSSNNLMETLHTLNDIVTINSESTTNKKEVYLNKQVHKTLKHLNPLLEENNATVITAIPLGTSLQVIPSYLDNMLIQIISNSIKYKKPNVRPEIKLSLSYVQNYTVLSIEDNGIGLDMKKYGEKLFGMYKTFHEHNDAKGLGLYIVKNQIEAMNGKINAQSQVNVGTTINLYFNEEN
ncbi:PAS domain-containing sensor histidine kinase [Arenibacter latericius]|uniref:PAS domain-containing sensor histidine kinase n=1 Tax=Arenibacter latericius TaxID=86104 RepID=UPI0004057B06|nr:PAS domain-containing protein [Arenibacter latericius]